jgi:spoIIIJ-associated protein
VVYGGEEKVMDYIEVSGKTVDDALTNALVKLGTTSDKVEYTVKEKGSTGILGLFNKPAVILVRKKEEKNQEEPEAKIKTTAEVKPHIVQEKQEKPVVVEAKEEKEQSEAGVLSNEEIEKRIKNFLKEMFTAMGMEVNVDVIFDDKNDCVKVDLSGENMGVLIGKRGQTLDSIQYLTSLVVNKGKEKYVRIKMDTEDYRNRRKETLESLAKNIAYKVKRSRRPVSLEPMNPYERRIIHSALQNDKYVSTRSEGEEPFRHVVVYLDKEKASGRYDK